MSVCKYFVRIDAVRGSRGNSLGRLEGMVRSNHLIAGGAAVLLLLLLAGGRRDVSTSLMQKTGGMPQLSMLEEANMTAAEENYNENKEKFAEEHPNQAEKVHLKHVAESQNELREEYKREREEALEALAETNRARNAIVVILVIIVLITISFEKLAHHIKHHVSEFVSPVVEMLFKELTVLGFIALLVFMSIKTGLPQELSTMIFGTPSELVEMFDETHVLLFFIVLLFVGISGLILNRFSALCAEMDEWEQFAADGEKVGKGLDQILNMQFKGKALSEEIKTFLTLRDGFINPALKLRHNIDASIKFSDYIKDCTSAHFMSLVEVEPWTWGVILVMLFLARLYMMIPFQDIKLALFLFLGIIILFVTIVARNKMLDVYMKLCLPGHGHDATPYYLWKKRKSTAEDCKGMKGEADTRGWLYKTTHGDRSPNAHESLFWFGANGPVFMVHLVQTTIFVCSVYLSLIALNFFGQFSHSNMHAICLLCLSFIAPGIMLCYYTPQLIKLVVIVTSVEMLRNNKVLYNLEEKIKCRRRKFVNRLVHTIKSHAKRILRQGDGSVDKQALDSAREREVSSLFAVFEEECPSRPGAKYIPKAKVGAFFVQIGMPLDKSEQDDMVVALGDGLDGILYDQTVEFMASGGGSALSDQMIDAVFVDVDKEESDPQKKYDNEITEDEVCSKLALVNSYFGTAEGGQLLVDWVHWAVETHQIEVTMRGSGSEATRCFTPHTFRKLIRSGTGSH